MESWAILREGGISIVFLKALVEQFKMFLYWTEISYVGFLLLRLLGLSQQLFMLELFYQLLELPFRAWQEPLAY